MSTGSASFQRPSLSHNGHKTIAPTRAFTVNLVKFRGPLDWGSPKSSSARDSPRSTSDASRSNKSSRDYDRDYDRPSSSRSYDSFDRLSDGKGSGKFGRPSFGQQKSDSFRPRESSLNNSSRDGHSDDSYKRTSSYTSTSGGENGRDYDPFVSRRSNLPSQNKSPDHDYLYSPNVVISALHNTLRTPYTLYYSSTVLQNRKK
ncbi:hypothetical protein BGZ58_004493 [Dissophora ornata]|nr:hypothetical protein BGZ58_004493 [Dissophora ornata]